MLMTIQTIDIPDWKLTDFDVELRIRPTKDFIPKGIDNIISSKSHEAYSCVYDSGTLTVPEVELYTTTDSDLGDNVRYIAEFWNPVKRQRIASFAVNNFKLSPEIAIQNGVPVEPEWEAVAAFNRLYKRNNRSGLNIDLSEYPTRNEVINLIADAMEGVVAGGYTNEQIDLMISSLSQYVYDTINSFTLGGNYYTKPQTDTIVSTAITQLLTGENLNTTVYTKNAINLILEQYASQTYVDSTFHTADETENLIEDAISDVVALLANYYTQSQINTLLTNALTNYYTEEETDLLLSTTLSDYYTKTEVDDLIDEFENNQITENTYSFSTSSIALDEISNHTVSLGKTYSLSEITVDAPARVRIYQTAEQRTADASRGIPTTLSELSLLSGIGLVAEVVLPKNGSLTQRLSPAPIGINGDSTRNVQAYVSVQKKSEGSGTVGVTIKVIKMEK